MSGFIKGEDRHQATLFPERLDDYIAEDSAVRVIDVFLDDLDPFRNIWLVEKNLPFLP
jgi:transposase